MVLQFYDNLKLHLVFIPRSLEHIKTEWRAQNIDRFVFVISDCHLSAGRIYEGHLNPYEDFHFGEEMCEFIDYISSGDYGAGPSGPVEVELFINGDFLDFLSVPLDGEFDEVVTEEIANRKLDAILAGHPEVMRKLKEFAGKPGKRITYLIGNHDADLFFPSIRRRITEAWDPGGRADSTTVQVIADRDRVRFGKGVEIHHGNQFEAVHVLNFSKPFLESFLEKPVLNLPWGSFYVLKIINRLKGEREFIDKIRPIKVYVLFGLIIDTWFTLKFCMLSAYYFLKTRFVYSPKRRSRLKVTAEILAQETDFLLDLEKQAREHLDKNTELQTVIFGHTHKPMDKVYPDGKQYINTGTWTRMINLDWRGFGQQFVMTFAMIRLRDDGSAHCDLRQWTGVSGPHRAYRV